MIKTYRTIDNQEIRYYDTTEFFVQLSDGGGRFVNVSKVVGSLTKALASYVLLQPAKKQIKRVIANGHILRQTAGK